MIEFRIRKIRSNTIKVGELLLAVHGSNNEKYPCVLEYRERRMQPSNLGELLTHDIWQQVPIVEEI